MTLLEWALWPVGESSLLQHLQDFLLILQKRLNCYVGGPLRRC